jgi:alpha-glucosidase (family GH31 glycosyl hydrolase)
VEDQFLFGSAVMVAPILTEYPSRNLWVPPGRWYDAWNGEPVEGPKWMKVTAGLDRVPLYFRGGCAVVMSPDACWAEETTGGEQTVRVFPDSRGWAKMEIEGEETVIRVEAEIGQGAEARIAFSGPAGSFRLELYGADGTETLLVNGEAATSLDRRGRILSGRFRIRG